MATVIGDKAMNLIVSGLENVNEAVWKSTKEIAKKAERNLAAHRHSGNAKIEHEFMKTDGWVWLVDPAALSIEFGHWLGKDGLWNDRPFYVQGLHIISRAAGI